VIAHLEIAVHGEVQGVGFRQSVRRQARQLGLAGLVKNQPDGSVLIVAEGPRHDVQQLVDWCREGPSAADVDRVEVSEGSPQQLTGFRIVG
jgi:acylphosphatase